jgi:PKD repeat protein
LKLVWKSVFTLAFLLSCLPLAAQNYPMPSKVGQQPALCDPGTGTRFCEACSGDNANKPTVQYGGPLSKHVGRILDSSTTGIVQNKGMRTLRAHKIRIQPARGTAPARAYMQMGETFVAYSLSTFFTTTLPGPMIAANEIPAPHNSFPWGGRAQYERLAPFDAYFYPEHKNAGWSVPIADGTDRLFDFDFDDRGNAYVAESIFGWGIVKDLGETGGKHLTSSVQVIGADNKNVTPHLLFVLKAGPSAPATSKYHVFFAGRETLDIVHFNATNVTDPSSLGTRRPSDNSKLMRWAKNDDERVLALLNEAGVLRLYDYDTFIANGSPFLEVNPSSDRVIRDISFDQDGVLWAIESAKKLRTPVSNVIRKFKPVGSGYNETVIANAYPGAYAPYAVYSAGGYVAVLGSTTSDIDMQLFKVEGNGLRHLDTDDFFRKYYHAAPAGFSNPGIQNRTPNDNYVYLYKHTDGKTYLFYHVNGMGDVYELEGNGLNASILQGFGTTNPHAQPSQTGPFPGDPVTFKATSSAGGSQILQWIFGNPDAGNNVNIRSGATGVNITHQYTGLDTAAEVTASKTVTVNVSGDASTSDTVVVNLKVPTARIALKSSGEVITGSGFVAVAGDKFVDASDGSVNGHFGKWTIGPAGVPTNLYPDGEIEVGSTLGAHTVEYSGYYGREDGAFTIHQPYVTTIPSRSYTVLPFLASITPATRNGTTVTYDAVGRFSTNQLFLSATQWTYKWTLTNAAGAETLAKTDTINIGANLPDFPIPSSVLEAANGGKVTLKLSVAPGAVPDTSFAEYTTSVNVKLPNMTIVLTGCESALADCSIRATAPVPADADSWQLSWDVKRGATPVKSGTGNPLATFKPTEAGVYTVTVTETVYGVQASKNFTVAPTSCGPPPSSVQLAFAASCQTNCGVGELITFNGSAFLYTVQPCDEFVWNFGDGSATATGLDATHAFTSTGSFIVKLTARNSSNPTGTTVQKTVTVGTIIQPPGCTAPSAATFTMNCTSGTSCKAGSAINFTPRRSGAAIQSCDTATWTFGDGSSSVASDRPSKTFSEAGTYLVKLTISNQHGSANYEQNVVIVPGTTTEPCSGGPTVANTSLVYNGTQSGCASTNATNCVVNESIEFSATFFNYTVQNCDRFEWNFGDNTAVSPNLSSAHPYAENGTYVVKLKVYNTSKPNGTTFQQIVTVGPRAQAKVVPELAFAQFATAGAIGAPVTFTVNVTNDVNATAWAWDFGDGTKDSTSQAGVIGKTTSIQHTYTKVGTFAVSVKARNADDIPTAQTGQAVGLPGIAITDIPEYKFMIPVAISGNPWRTDVQIYTPDPSVSPQNPLQMHAMLRDIPATLEIRNSTQTYEDFVKVAFGRANDFGPVIITVRTKVAPQIWTRTYNQTANGTYGQFIPAIRIDAAAGGGSAFGAGKYYLAGLRNGTRFRTNLGFVNPNPQPVNVTVKVFDDTQSQVGQFPLTLGSYELDQFPITHAKGVPNLSREHPFSLQIEVPTGQWLIAYASFVDNGSDDPTYYQAVRESDLNLADNANIVIPGVGHVGEWRSDVTIFNPDANSVMVDLAYHDQTGNKVAEAKGVQIRSHEFVQYADLLKQGVLGSVGDSTGILRVTVNNPFPPTTYPLAYARTYNDKGTGKTFGQGIGGFAAARANVKPGKPALVAGIRSNDKYYTNVGVVNVSATAAAVTVKLLDPASGAEQILKSYNLQPNQSVIERVTLPSQLETGSLKIEVTGGNVWAFGSMVDILTADPEYIAATPLVQ